MKVFVVGKGGVGKSTVCVALALILQSKDTLLVSLDPAHNISDIVKNHEVMLNFEIVEPDFEKELSIYLKNLTDEMKRESFRYLTVFNLENLLDVLRYSPGTEEHMLLENIKRYIDRRHVVFDTPPTGLFLKVLGLLDSSILWMDKLMELRQDILERKGIKEDPILTIIEKGLKEYVKLKNILQNEAIFIGVTTEDRLSLKETERILGFLREKGYSVPLLVVNRAKEKKVYLEGIKHVFIPEYHDRNPFEISRKIHSLLKLEIQE